MSDYAENTAENDENKIPVNIITGFLGSGKTTLLNIMPFILINIYLLSILLLFNFKMSPKCHLAQNKKTLRPYK